MPIALLPVVVTLPNELIVMAPSVGRTRLPDGMTSRVGLLLIRTVPLPAMMVPWLVGGLAKGPPTGMCGGRLMAVLPRVAAGFDSMSTLVLQLPEMMPTNGIGVGVGTGPAGEGTRMTWVSVATI